MNQPRPVARPDQGGSQRPAPPWLAVRERGSVLGIRTLVWLSTAFGRAPARLVLRVVVAYYVLFHPALRAISADYLRRVGARATPSMIYRHVLRFAQVSLDRAFIVMGKHRHFVVGSTGHHHLRALAEQKRGAILLGAHLGSFEAMRMAGDLADFRIHFLGYFRNARMMNAALERLNPKSPTRLIAIDPANVDFVFRVRECIERGDWVAVLGDRVGHGGRTASVDFLGAKADFPTGPYMLAAILRCPIYLTFGLYRSPNRYDLYCEPFEEQPHLPRKGRDRALAAYAQRYATRLEHYVRLAPDNWFNFFEFWRAS